MDHAITVREVLLVVGIPAGLFVLSACLFGLIALFNPFRSGH